MEVSEMTEKEQAAIMIDIYTDLQRIQKAEDKDKELSNQLRKAKAKHEALGIVTENLTIEQQRSGTCHRSFALSWHK